jgi:hypothetical protein
VGQKIRYPICNRQKSQSMLSNVRSEVKLYNSNSRIPDASQGGRCNTESVSWVLKAPPTSEQAADRRPKNAIARTAVDVVAPTLKAGLLNDLEYCEQNTPVLDKAR